MANAELGLMDGLIGAEELPLSDEAEALGAAAEEVEERWILWCGCGGSG